MESNTRRTVKIEKRWEKDKEPTIMTKEEYEKRLKKVKSKKN